VEVEYEQKETLKRQLHRKRPPSCFNLNQRNLNLGAFVSLPCSSLNEIKISPHSRRALGRFNQRVAGAFSGGSSGPANCKEVAPGSRPIVRLLRHSEWGTSPWWNKGHASDRRILTSKVSVRTLLAAAPDLMRSGGRLARISARKIPHRSSSPNRRRNFFPIRTASRNPWGGAGPASEEPEFPLAENSDGRLGRVGGRHAVCAVHVRCHARRHRQRQGVVRHGTAGSVRGRTAGVHATDRPRRPIEGSHAAHASRKPGRRRSEPGRHGFSTSREEIQNAYQSALQRAPVVAPPAAPPVACAASPWHRLVATAPAAGLHPQPVFDRRHHPSLRRLPSRRRVAVAPAIACPFARQTYRSRTNSPC